MTKQPGLYGRQWKLREVHELIYQAGWKDPVTMVKMVATTNGESDCYEGAIGKINADGSQDWGMFQLNSGHWATYASSPEEFYLKCIDATQAVVIARTLFDYDKKHGGDGFGPWYAYGGQRYKDSLKGACLSLANFVATRLEIPLVA